LAGALLLAVPVAVAAAIGFGNSFSGITGGLSSIASGPSTTTMPTPTASPRRLNNAVVALAAPAPRGGGTEGGGSDSDGGGDVHGDLGTGGGGGGGQSNTQPGGADVNAVPDVQLPPGGGGGDGDEIANGVNNLLDQVDTTVSGLLGGQ
jgi:hypothetical protein